MYDIGVIARGLDVGPPSADLIAKAPTLEGATQVLLQTLGRVRVRHFSGRAGRYQAEVEPIEEGAIQGSPERIEDIATRFKAYAEAHNLKVLDSWPPLHQLHDSGRVADIVAQHLTRRLPIWWPFRAFATRGARGGYKGCSAIGSGSDALRCGVKKLVICTEIGTMI